MIVPIRVEDVQPSGDFEYFLGTPHWLDAITPPFEQHLDAIADSAKYWLDRIRSNQGKATPAEIKPAPAGPGPGERTSPSDRPVLPRKRFTIVITAAVIVLVGIGGFFTSRIGEFFAAYHTAQEQREDPASPLPVKKGVEQNPESSATEGVAQAPRADPQLAATLAALHLRSMASTVPATIRFTNELTSGVVGYWIDFDGTARRYFELGTAGRLYSQRSKTTSGSL